MHDNPGQGNSQENKTAEPPPRNPLKTKLSCKGEKNS